MESRGGANAGRGVRSIRARELTAQRILAAMQRRALDLPHRFAWSAGTGQSAINRDRLEEYRNRHRGQRCFIMGNGPSLTKMDLSPLADECTIGLNRIYLLFPKLRFEPTYYCAANELVLQQFSEEVARLHMPKFLDWSTRDRFDSDDSSNLFIRQALTLSDFFAGDITNPICSGGTITYIAMQIAYYMGFQQVILIGVDHSFADTGVPNREEVRTSDVDLNHFHPDYFPKGSRWQMPDLMRSESAYRLARDAFEKNGRQILNATEGGQLGVFEQVDYQSLFE